MAVKSFRQKISETAYGDPIALGADAVNVSTDDGENAQTKFDNIEGDIGDLANLETTEKNNLVESINEINSNFNNVAMSRTRGLTATLTTSGWSSAAPYTQTITITGIKSTDVPIVSCGTPSTLDSDTYKALTKAYSCIDRGVTAANAMTFYCYTKKPEVDIPILVKI